MRRSFGRYARSTQGVRGRPTPSATHYQQTADSYREALLELRAAGDGYHEAIPLIHLGQTHQAAGQIESARNAWREALCILERLDHPDAEDVRAWLKQLDISPDVYLLRAPRVPDV